MSPFLVHKLGDTNYGLWILIQSVTGYMGLIDVGLRVSIVKYISRLFAVSDTDGINKTFSTAIAMYGFLAIIVVMVTMGMELIFPKVFSIAEDMVHTARIVLLLAGLNLALTLFVSVFNGFLGGLQRYDLTNKIGISVLILRSLIIFIAVSKGYGIIALAIIQLLAQILTGMLLIRECRQQFKKLWFRMSYVSKESLKSLFSYSIFILMNNLAMVLLFKSGEVITGMFISTAAVTYYAIAGGLTQYLSKIIGTMTQVLHPYASAQEAKGDIEGIKHTILVGTKICLIIALPICISLILIGDKFIASWMGESYALVSGPLLVFLTISRLFWLSQSATGNILLGIGKHKFLTTLNVITGVCSVICGLIFIPYHGLIGLVIGSAIPIILTQLFILPVYTCSIFQMKKLYYFRLTWLGPLLASIPFGLILIELKKTSLLNSIVGIIISVLLALPVFIVFAYFTCFSKKERKQYSDKVQLFFIRKKNKLRQTN
jgi:O-antigen/teichoic acid export membrane protein